MCERWGSDDGDVPSELSVCKHTPHTRTRIFSSLSSLVVSQLLLLRSTLFSSFACEACRHASVSWRDKENVHLCRRPLPCATAPSTCSVHPKPSSTPMGTVVPSYEHQFCQAGKRGRDGSSAGGEGGSMTCSGQGPAHEPSLLFSVHQDWCGCSLWLRSVLQRMCTCGSSMFAEHCHGARNGATWKLSGPRIVVSPSFVREVPNWNLEFYQRDAAGGVRSAWTSLDDGPTRKQVRHTSSCCTAKVLGQEDGSCHV